MARKRQYERRSAVSDAEKQVYQDRLKTEVVERLSRAGMSTYGLAKESGIDYMTIKRVLKAEGCQYWTAKVIMETLDRFDAAAAPTEA